MGSDGFDMESIGVQITKRYDEWTGKRGKSYCCIYFNDKIAISKLS
jgi:hypothetical protein